MEKKILNDGSVENMENVNTENVNEESVGAGRRKDGRRNNGGRREGTGRPKVGRTRGIAARVSPEVADALEELTVMTGKTKTDILSELIMERRDKLLGVG